MIVPQPEGSTLDTGELLLGELNCTACHAATPAAAARLESRAAPRLGRDGLRLTPGWIRSWLADPAGTKPGSLMPDLLHGLPETGRAEAIEALTQFLVSVQPPGPADAVSADPARAVIGRRLYHSLGCAACHAPFERGEAGEQAFDAAQGGAVPLGDLARKYPAGELVRFLRDPGAHRPSGRMPSLSLSESEATDLAVYLLRAQLDLPPADSAPVAGLRWDYFEGEFRKCAELAAASPVASGVTNQVTAEVARRDALFGLRFNGGIEVPTDGEYTFWARSDDGSQVLVDGRVVVDNDGEHGAETRSGRVALTAGYHPFQVLFTQVGGGFELKIEWAGPGFRRQVIPPEVFRHFARPMRPVDDAPWIADAAGVARGRDWFERLNCGACHAGADLPPGRPASALDALASQAASGCLADPAPATVPRYALSAEQRTALRAATTRSGELAAPVAPARRVEATLTRFNCLACHERDGVGGPVAGGRADWFETVGEVDLGDEGRIPPALTGVGAKLRPEWLAQVLSEGSKVRPYMATRMPVFGTPQVSGLPAALRAVDRRADAPEAPAVTDRDAKLGWKLVGNDGLGCVACHTFGKLGSLGIPALGLDTMGHRLEWDWFRRYLPDPAALRPGTRMPTFWPDGQAVNDAILGGDTDAQIQALWAYLAEGARAEVPAGLIRGRQELVPAGEP